MEDPYDPLIAEAIAQQPRHRSALAATLGGVADAWRSVPPRPRARFGSGFASWRAPHRYGVAMARNSAASEEAIADALRARGVVDQEARIAAAATIAALNAALLHWAENSSDDLGLGDHGRSACVGRRCRMSATLAAAAATRVFRNGAADSI